MDLNQVDWLSSISGKLKYDVYYDCSNFYWVNKILTNIFCESKNRAYGKELSQAQEKFFLDF